MRLLSVGFSLGLLFVGKAQEPQEDDGTVFFVPAVKKFFVDEDSIFTVTKELFGSNLSPAKEDDDFELIFVDSPSASAFFQDGQQFVKFKENLFTTNSIPGNLIPGVDGSRREIPGAEECTERQLDGCPATLVYHLFDAESNVISQPGEAQFFIRSVNDGNPIIGADKLTFLFFENATTFERPFNDPISISSDFGAEIFKIKVTIDSDQGLFLEDFAFICDEEEDCVATDCDDEGFCKHFETISLLLPINFAIDGMILKGELGTGAISITVDDLIGSSTTKVFTPEVFVPPIFGGTLSPPPIGLILSITAAVVVVVLCFCIP